MLPHSWLKLVYRRLTARPIRTTKYRQQRRCLPAINAIERLEPRLVPAGSLMATMSGVDLTVTDTDALGKNNQWTLSISSGNYVLSDANEQFGTAPDGWLLSGDGKSIRTPIGSFSGSITINGSGGDDSLTVELSTGNAIANGVLNFNGGGQATPFGDSLTIAGGEQGMVTYDYTNANDGSVGMSEFGTVNYTGLEPITNTGSANDVILNLPAVGSIATLGDDGTIGNGLSRLSSDPATFETTDFTNPTNTLTINAGNAADTLALDAIPDFTAGLIVGAQGPLTSITVNSGVALSTGTAALELHATTIILKTTETISSAGAQTYGGAVLLQRNTTTSGSAITFDGTVDGVQFLNVNSSGTTTFGGAVGSITPLAGLTTDPAGTTVLSGDVRTAPIQYGADPFTNIFRAFGPDFHALSETPATMAGFTVTGINSMAMDPITSQYYVVVRLAAVSGRSLGIIDPATAVITNIGSLGDNFSSLTFSSTGELFGVTGDGAAVPESLYSIDKATATKTLIRALGNGADGEVVSFNPLDGFYYHWSGNGTVVFEKIDPSFVTVTGIPTADPEANGEVFGATFDPITGGFIICDISSNVEHWTTTGVVTPIGTTTDLANSPVDIRGLLTGVGTGGQAFGDTVKLAGSVTVDASSIGFLSGASFETELNGPNIDADYFQLRVQGPLDLGGSVLSVIPGFDATTGSAFTIIANDASDPIVNTFDGLAEGTVFTATAGPFTSRFQISYVGGDGNDVVVTALNDAPTLANPGSFTYTENDPATAVAAALTVLDPDSTTLASATVTLTNFVAPEDSLSFTNDGSTMGNIAVDSNVGGVLTLSSSGSTATLAEWQAALRAVVYANSSDNPTTASRLVEFVVTDGTEPSNVLTSTVAITAINDTPTLDTDPTPMLPPVPPKTDPNGALVGDLLVGVGDLDAGDAVGIAVTGLLDADVKNRVRGVWQFKLDGDLDWTDIGAVSDASALLLSPTARVRFLPNKNVKGLFSLTFKAWDQSDALSEGTKVLTSGSLAFSSDSDRAWVAIGKTRPPVDSLGRTVLKSVKEDRKSSKVFKVRDVIGIAGLETPTNAGIAIVDATSLNGTWEFKLAKQKGYLPVGAVTETSALLLGPKDRLRFIPNANADGDASISFLAWNETGGVAGDTVDPTATPTAFAVDTGAATIDIIAINDAPTLTQTVTTLGPVAPGGTTTPVSFASLFTGSDVESLTIGIAITKLSGQGKWQYRIGAGAFTDIGLVSAGRPFLLSADAELQFVADPGASGTARIHFRTWDQTFGTVGLREKAGLLSKSTAKLSVEIA